VEEARRYLDKMFALATPDDKCMVFQYMETDPLIRICYKTHCEFIEKLDIDNCQIVDAAERAYYLLVQYLCADEKPAGQSVLEYADSASNALEDDSAIELQIAAHTHIVLGKLYATLGRRDDAIREGTRAVQVLPTSIDAVDGPDILYELADIYMMVGDHEAAIDQIESLLSAPCSYTMRFIGLDPLYEPLRDHPRYRALLEKYPDQ
jgi:tetratricopeptide (TPR) repeat protein